LRMKQSALQMKQALPGHGAPVYDTRDILKS
jgi:hypothetical protein